MTDADRFHVQPTYDQFQRWRQDCPPEHPEAPLPSQPTVIATSVVDLNPLVDWWQAELSRERTAAADARIEARGHREEVVRLEARLAEMTAKADDWRKKCNEMVSRNARLASDSELQLKAIGEMAADMASLRGELGDANGKLKGLECQLRPGSTAAVIEAYRLLVGDSLEWKRAVGWYDNKACADQNMEDSTYALIKWLNAHAPGGEP